MLVSDDILAFEMARACYLCSCKSERDLADFRNYIICQGLPVSRSLSDLGLQDDVKVIERPETDFLESKHIAQAFKSVYLSLPMPGASSIMESSPSSFLMIIKSINDQ